MHGCLSSEFSVVSDKEACCLDHKVPILATISFPQRGDTVPHTSILPKAGTELSVLHMHILILLV